MLEKVENLYLNFFRYFLIFFASISLIVGLINLLISFSMIMTKPDLVEEANLPNWSSIKYQVLPLVNPMTKLEEGKASISSESKENKENNEKQQTKNNNFLQFDSDRFRSIQIDVIPGLFRFV